jgi:hypothetical protein
MDGKLLCLYLTVVMTFSTLIPIGQVSAAGIQNPDQLCHATISTPETTDPHWAVDVSAAETITNITAAYPYIQLYQGEMRMGGKAAWINYSVHVKYLTGDQDIQVLLGLKRTDETGNYYFPILKTITMGPTDRDYTDEFDWYEASSITVGNWTISLFVSPVASGGNDVEDTNPANNYAYSPYIVKTRSWPVDVTGDGVVNVLDQSVILGAFDSRPGDQRWNPLADVNGDGVVDQKDLNLVALNWQKTFLQAMLEAQKVQSSTSVSCSPNPVSVGSPVTCIATVSGSNPTGTVTWSTSSSTGSFSQSVCTLSDGSCSTFYTENSTGSETITARYSGDSNVRPSSGSATLTVFINITVGVNVTVHPTSDLKLTFSNVTAAGYAMADKTSTVEAPVLANLVGQYYDIGLTANYSGSVTVSLAYDDTDMGLDREGNLQMMQYTPIPGDVVNYGEVNILDIFLIAHGFGATPESPNWNAAGDITGSQYLVPDGKIDIRDIFVCARNFSKTSLWTSIMTYIDTELNVVRGETSHFSIIGIH